MPRARRPPAHLGAAPLPRVPPPVPRPAPLPAAPSCGELDWPCRPAHDPHTRPYTRQPSWPRTSRPGSPPTAGRRGRAAAAFESRRRSARGS
eukprot:scaffold14789_cov105-Isochrysis_galbana.AAC.1